MRKRLRKRNHLGEFTEWGAGVVIRLTSEDFDFLDTFVDDLLDVVEAQRCGLTAMSDRGVICGVLSPEKGVCFSTAKYVVAQWLEQCDRVATFSIGKAKDAWRDSFDEVFDELPTTTRGPSND